MFSDLLPIDVHRAAHRIRDIAVRTPLRRSEALSALAGGDVFLKLETEQLTGSFKIRGALNTLAGLPAEVRRRGVVASSAGNHGLGVAYAAREFGAPATIYVPRTAPQVKKEGIAALGALVDDSAADYDAAMVLAKAHAEREGVPFINPCLGDPLLAGQGTVALEIVEELPEVAAVVVCVGGGGLLGGMGCFLRPVAPGVRILGAQSDQTAAMSRSLAAGRLVEIPSAPTLADGLAGQIDDEALAIGQYALDDMATVSEAELGRAIAWLWRHERATVEGAGAAATAALLAGRFPTLPTPAVAIVSGRNIDPARHAEVLARHVTASSPPPSSALRALLVAAARLLHPAEAHAARLAVGADVAAAATAVAAHPAIAVGHPVPVARERDLAIRHRRPRPLTRATPVLAESRCARRPRARPACLATLTADGRHVRAVAAHHLAAAAAGDACLVRRPLVRGALRVRRLAALAGDLALPRGVHGREATAALP